MTATESAALTNGTSVIFFGTRTGVVIDDRVTGSGHVVVCRNPGHAVRGGPADHEMVATAVLCLA